MSTYLDSYDEDFDRIDHIDPYWEKVIRYHTFGYLKYPINPSKPITRPYMFVKIVNGMLEPIED